MKTQIRRGVFETNSSSTHSLQLAQQTIDEAKNNVDERIKKLYKNNICDNIFDESEYIVENTLLLKGFRIEDGDESSCVYYIINNWIAKIQFLAMLLNEYVYNIEGYNEKIKSYNSNDYFRYSDDILQELDVYKRFVNCIKQYAKQKGLNIKDVKLSLNESTYVEYFKFNNEDFFDGKITVEKLENLFYTVMNDSFTLTYSDEAYRPYSSPSVYIY